MPSLNDYQARLLSYPRVGFSIEPCLHEWRARFSPEIVQLVSAAPLKFLRALPPQSHRPLTRIYRPDEARFYCFDIDRRLLIGAIEEIPQERHAALQHAWFAPEHLVPKKTDLPFRTVYNGHVISQYLDAPPTEMKGLPWLFQNLPRNGWMYGYDIKDAFFSLVVDEKDRDFLCFQFGDRIFRYRTLPQGIKPSSAYL